MGSFTFDGVRFQVFSRDHEPPHVHGFYAVTKVVIELVDANSVGIRSGSVVPPDAKRSDVRRIVELAVTYYSELMHLWEATHGKTRS